MSVLTFTGTGADSADHERSGLDGMSVLTFPGTGLDSADHGRSGLNRDVCPDVAWDRRTLPITGVLEWTGSLFRRFL